MPLPNSIFELQPGRCTMFSNELVSKALHNSPRLTDSLSPVFPTIKVPRLRRNASPSAFLRVAPQVSPGRIATLLFTPSRERSLGRPPLDTHRRSVKIPFCSRRKPSPPRAPLRLLEQESLYLNADPLSSQQESRRFRSPSGVLPISRGGRIRLASLFGPQ